MRKTITIFLLTVLFAGLVSAQGGRKDLAVLLVHDDEDATTTTDGLREAITGAGFVYSDYNAVTDGAPSADLLAGYELVIWTTGKNYPTSRFWDRSVPDDIKANAGLLSYIDNGGMLWVVGLNVLSEISTSRPNTFAAGDFTYDYLGISVYDAQAKSDDDGVGLPLMTAVADNGISTIDTVNWKWSSIQFADLVTPTSSAKSIYNAGPADYVFAGKSCAVYNEPGDAKILSSFIRWDAFETADLALDVTTEILDYFDQFAALKDPVESIVITTLETDFVITENNGSLQVSATVLPVDANNRTVTFSLAESSVAATITPEGLLTASGLDSGNGVATIIATANDGGGVTATQDVVISNQTLGSGYKVLLVNDNGNGTERYMEIDTALTAGGYNYKIYNIVETGVAPDYDYLSSFHTVIWYTGNDGVDLHFWDVSDSTDIKCNAALKQFADNGGTVWVQGLDFLYDIWGGNYTDKNASGDSVIAAFEAGDFIYDYMGISNYVAQSHRNETSGNYDGVEQLDLTEDNVINKLDPIAWTYSSMWYVDAVDVTENATPLYYMGPETYDFSLYYAMLYNENGDARFITSTFETARIDNQENTNQLFKEVLDYFDDVTGVKSQSANSFDINVYPNPATSEATIDFTIERSEMVTMNIVDISGKIVYNLSFNAIKGMNSQTVDMSSISSGVYNVVVSSKSSRTNQRLVIVR